MPAKNPTPILPKNKSRSGGPDFPVNRSRHGDDDDRKISRKSKHGDDEDKKKSKKSSSKHREQSSSKHSDHRRKEESRSKHKDRDKKSPSRQGSRDKEKRDKERDREREREREREHRDREREREREREKEKSRKHHHHHKSKKSSSSHDPPKPKQKRSSSNGEVIIVNAERNNNRGQTTKVEDVFSKMHDVFEEDAFSIDPSEAENSFRVGDDDEDWSNSMSEGGESISDLGELSATLLPEFFGSGDKKGDKKGDNKKKKKPAPAADATGFPHGLYDNDDSSQASSVRRGRPVKMEKQASGRSLSAPNRDSLKYNDGGPMNGIMPEPPRGVARSKSDEILKNNVFNARGTRRKPQQQQPYRTYSDDDGASLSECSDASDVSYSSQRSRQRRSHMNGPPPSNTLAPWQVDKLPTNHGHDRRKQTQRTYSGNSHDSADESDDGDGHKRHTRRPRQRKVVHRTSNYGDDPQQSDADSDYSYASDTSMSRGVRRTRSGEDLRRRQLQGAIQQKQKHDNNQNKKGGVIAPFSGPPPKTGAEELEPWQKRLNRSITSFDGGIASESDAEEERETGSYF